ncbi:fluoride efflux transporter CrcB [Thalassobacillus hwangdonensis]|uniref:Fluoride-specific ion channel FluC n=1 Tax=Thalassobacillus hwangdonensis TaxID=546108 RepID=A0ABW3L476_9BACI
MVYFWVGIAGFLGASLRYLIGVWLMDADMIFPFSTLTVNLVGSFLLAWFTFKLVHQWSLSSKWKTAIGTGFVGSFTTFSTLSVDTVTLVNRGDAWLGVLYIFVSIVGGLLLSNLGYSLSRKGGVV